MRRLYYLLDIAKPIARPAIPIAEIAVRILLTCGFWIKTADLSTLQINIKYQEVETIGQRQPKINIPQPNEKSLGTNSGIKATAKTAALTFVKLVISPNRNADQDDDRPGWFRSNLPCTFFRVSKVWIERKNRNATPDHFKIE